jgi:hypothetical protein
MSVFLLVLVGYTYNDKLNIRFHRI